MFGDAVGPGQIAAAEWLDTACAGAWGTVGALVPNDYEALLRVEAPPGDVDDWWPIYRDLYDAIASVGAAHTSTPGRAWYAIWEGHGYDTEGLDSIPLIDRPHRRHYFLTGPVAAINGLQYPGWDGWRNPDLFWPDDRRWFVATDVDFWSLFIGGSSAFVSEVAACVPTKVEPVTFDTKLPIEL